MLKLTVVIDKGYDEETSEFLMDTYNIELEHSLASLSKWEEIWEKPLLTTEDKTEDMNISYLECMCLTPNVPSEVFRHLTAEQQTEIAEYLDKKHTATWFSNEAPQPRSGEVLTAELMYYWMSSFQIDWQAQYWPLNKFLTLIKVFSVKQDNKPKQQRSHSRRMDIAAENARRRAELNSKG